MTASTMTTTRAGQAAPTAGWICLFGGLIGLMQGLYLLFVTPVVGEDQFSYPFTATGFTVAQVTFGIQHLMLVVGLVPLARSEWARRSRLTVIGFWIAAAGFLLLTAMELLALTAANAATASAEADLINSLYGIPTIICGIGLVLGGLGFARTSEMTGWRRWLPLVLGVYVFVPLLPAVFAPYVWGRIAISVWMLLFVGLGWLLLRPAQRASA